MFISINRKFHYFIVNGLNVATYVTLGSESQGEPDNTCLSDHVKFMCSLAYSMLEGFFNGCSTGDITLQEIIEVGQEHNRTNLKKICDAVIFKCSEEEKTIFQWSILEHRIAEAIAFKSHRQILSVFCECLKGSHVFIKGM